jgi:hypothetical protein
MKSLLVHYKNKYPKGHVVASEHTLDAYDCYGNHRVALRKGGNGQLMDVGAEVGAIDKHDLAPIPKNCRVFKCYQDGTVKPSEEASERLAVASQVAVEGVVLSIEEYKKMGAKVDAQGNVSIEVLAQAAQ